MADNTITNVLSGCPSLELLEFSYCCLFTRTDLTNNKCLRKLVVDCYDQAGILEIIAPNLQSLVLSGGMSWSKCKVLDAKSLTDCYLNFFIYNDELADKSNAIVMLTSLFEDLSHIEVVTINEWVHQVLCLIEQQGLQCPMSKTIKCLELHTTLTTVDLVRIMCTLRSLNHLEKLLIEKWNFHKVYLPWFPMQDQVSLKNKSYWTAENIGFDLKLKTIKIDEVREDQLLDNQNEVLSLVEFLLKSAKFMEYMTIIANGSKDYLLELSNKLLSLPRSSPHAVVEMIIG